NIAGMVTYVYHLFPNVSIAVLSNHTTLSISEPLSPTQTRFITYRLTNKGDEGDAEDERAKRDASFVADTGGKEDRAVLQAIQDSLASGANQHFTYGKFEKAIVHFHKTLTGMLGQVESN
ncbi:MAG: aromatic ring-hydroxylating dioxygenase subunit alpha, partial [Gammaproteobacteria bacterium]|nr:aromatic ring-hydroxylating dioxygenase subunit alpha [Gammaproteobacteria bacterium]